MKDQMHQSVQYLNSPEAAEALDLDAYWPKWNSPWWHMLLLWELGMVHEIPRGAIDNFVNRLGKYLDHFPFTEDEFPPDKDPLADAMCHCQLGCLFQVLMQAGVDVEQALPFARPWFVRYQLPDGGYNCDEAVYLKESPRSSMVSTLPILESLLCLAKSGATDKELAALDRGAEYVLKRRLLRSLSKEGAIMDENWKKLLFPRFYEYDILRGLDFVIEWALVRDKRLDWSSIQEIYSLIDNKVTENSLAVERQIHAGSKTRARNEDGSWVRHDATLFPLLLSTSKIEEPSPWLTQSWQKTRDRLKELESLGLLYRDT